MNFLVSYTDALGLDTCTVARGWFNLLYIRMTLFVCGCYHVYVKPIF